MDTLKAKLIEVLTAVNFDGSPNRVFIQLVTTSIGKGMDELSARMSEDEIQIVKSEENADAVMTILEKYYSKDEIKSNMDKNFKIMMDKYVEHMLSTLSEEKRQEVLKILGNTQQPEEVIVM